MQPCCLKVALHALLASTHAFADGEAYIGEDYLVPGSTPLHVAVIINNISIVHAILQASCCMQRLLFAQLAVCVPCVSTPSAVLSQQPAVCVHAWSSAQAPVP